MATRALIGKEASPTDIAEHAYTPKQIKNIYVHHGHPQDGVGFALLANYINESSVNRLIDGGDISSMDKESVDYYKDKPDEDWDDIKPRINHNEHDMIKSAEDVCIEYVYIWSVESGWKVSCTFGSDSKFDFMPLKDALDMIIADEEGRW